MKKKWIWGAAVVLVLALSLGLYRFFTADDYRRVLPSRPLALAAVDWVRLSEENDMGMQDWQQRYGTAVGWWVSVTVRCL